MSGKIGWIDLTVEDAEEIRDFHSSITGWEPSRRYTRKSDGYL